MKNILILCLSLYGLCWAQENKIFQKYTAEELKALQLPAEWPTIRLEAAQITMAIKKTRLPEHMIARAHVIAHEASSHYSEIRSDCAQCDLMNHGLIDFEAAFDDEKVLKRVVLSSEVSLSHWHVEKKIFGRTERSWDKLQTAFDKYLLSFCPKDLRIKRGCAHRYGGTVQLVSDMVIENSSNNENRRELVWYLRLVKDYFQPPLSDAERILVALFSKEQQAFLCRVAAKASLFLQHYKDQISKPEKIKCEGIDRSKYYMDPEIVGDIGKFYSEYFMAQPAKDAFEKYLLKKIIIPGPSYFPKDHAIIKNFEGFTIKYQVTGLEGDRLAYQAVIL